ncbi:MAG: hypothetical protein K2G93_03450 [Rikenella sp.]|nr:hypothetical protein [Rikenella sp.]
MRNVGYSGYGWTLSILPESSDAYYLGFTLIGILPNSSNCRSYGFQLRCLQE